MKKSDWLRAGYFKDLIMLILSIIYKGEAAIDCIGRSIRLLIPVSVKGV